jgi:hypothetical protein
MQSSSPSENVYCHIYEDVRPIVPIPWKGAQGWRTLAPDQVEALELL